MAINIIVVAVTLLIDGFVAGWIMCPRSRSWFEAPKWQPLGWDQPPRPWRRIAAEVIGRRSTPAGILFGKSF
jgi:hypothetical protein